MKEGIYFGQELAADHPAVVARTPLHGHNLWPEVPSLRETVLEFAPDLIDLIRSRLTEITPGLLSVETVQYCTFQLQVCRGLAAEKWKRLFFR